MSFHLATCFLAWIVPWPTKNPRSPRPNQRAGSSLALSCWHGGLVRLLFFIYQKINLTRLALPTAQGWVGTCLLIWFGSTIKNRIHDPKPWPSISPFSSAVGVLSSGTLALYVRSSQKINFTGSKAALSVGLCVSMMSSFIMPLLLDSSHDQHNNNSNKNHDCVSEFGTTTTMVHAFPWCLVFVLDLANTGVKTPMWNALCHGRCWSFHSPSFDARVLYFSTTKTFPRQEFFQCDVLRSNIKAKRMNLVLCVLLAFPSVVRFLFGSNELTKGQSHHRTEMLAVHGRSVSCFFCFGLDHVPKNK